MTTHENISNDTWQSPLPDSHPLGSRLSVERPEYLDPEKADSPAEQLREIRRENQWTWTWLMQWAHDVQDRKENGTRLTLLRALVERHMGATYQTLADECDVAERTVRHHVKKLTDRGVVEKDGRPVIVRFTSDEMELLAREAASLG